MLQNTGKHTESIKTKGNIETKWVLMFLQSLRCWFLRCNYRIWKSLEINIALSRWVYPLQLPCFLTKWWLNFCLETFRFFNPLKTNHAKWSNTLKQSALPTNCLSVFDHFVGFALKGLIIFFLLFYFISMLSNIVQQMLESTYTHWTKVKHWPETSKSFPQK